jgi:hypothetical protein
LNVTRQWASHKENQVPHRHAFGNAMTWIRAAFCLMLAILGPTLAHADDADLVKITDSWKKRLDSVRTLDCAVQGTTLIPRGRFNGMEELPSTKGDFPEQDYTYETTTHWKIDFVKNHLRKELRGEIFLLDRGFFSPLYQVHVYDGEKLQRFRPRDKNTGAGYVPSEAQPDLYVETDAQVPFVLNAFDYPAFLAAGVIPHDKAALDVRKLHWQTGADRFRHHGTGTINGEDYAIVVTAAQRGLSTEYWVDTKRENTIRRIYRRAGARTMAVVEVEYEKKDLGWMPKTWTTQEFADRKEPSRVTAVTTVRVKHLSTNVALRDNDFTIKTEKGMVVHDCQTQRTFKVADDGKQLIPFERKK